MAMGTSSHEVTVSLHVFSKHYQFILNSMYPFTHCCASVWLVDKQKKTSKQNLSQNKIKNFP